MQPLVSARTVCLRRKTHTSTGWWWRIAIRSVCSADESSTAIREQAMLRLLSRHHYAYPAFVGHEGNRGLFDLGPAGHQLKQLILNRWRSFFIDRVRATEISSPCVVPRSLFEASGHVEKFCDLMVADLETLRMYRAEHLIEDTLRERQTKGTLSAQQLSRWIAMGERVPDGSAAELQRLIDEFNIMSPEGNALSAPREYNLMFSTRLGADKGEEKMNAFLRPELAQNVFSNFPRLLDYYGGHLPFGCGIVGQAFRNEIHPRGTMFRMREFTLAELEYFYFNDGSETDLSEHNTRSTLPMHAVEGEAAPLMPIGCSSATLAAVKDVVANPIAAFFVATTHQFLCDIGLNSSRLRFRQQEKEELAHYARETWDVEAQTHQGDTFNNSYHIFISVDLGWMEIAGIADRGQHDLSLHGMDVHRPFSNGPQWKDCKDVVLNQSIVSVQCSVVTTQAVGKAFRQESKHIHQHFSTLDTDQAQKLYDECERDGQVSFSTPTGSYTLDTTMITLRQQRVKVTGCRLTPSVLEPSFGIDRLVHALLDHCFHIQQQSDNSHNKQRFVLSLPPHIAPITCLIAPIVKDSRLEEVARSIQRAFEEKGIRHHLDNAGQSIGKRYLRADEAGIPFAVTIDNDTLQSGYVTVRDRDTTEQRRCQVEKLPQMMLDASAPPSSLLSQGHVTEK